MRIVPVLICVALLTTSASAQAIYTWNQTSAAAFGTAASWTPARTTPGTGDTLVFDGTVTPNAVVTGLATQTIGRLIIKNNAYVTFVASSAATLTIGGGASALQIGAGSTLLDSANSAITIALPTGTTGDISGTFRERGSTAATAHKLTTTDASSLTFESGSLCVIDTLSSSNLFGTTALNSVVFKSGSIVIQRSGSNPFGATQPSSVVVFQTGSKFSSQWTGSPSFSGRTYANFELNYTGASISNATGGGALSIDTLSLLAGSMNLNLTGGITIKGDINVGALDTLGFNPASVATLSLAGKKTQTVSGAGVLTFGANCNLNINDTSSNIVLNRNVVLIDTLLLTAGKVITGSDTITLGATPKVIGTGSYIDGSVVYNLSGTGTYLYPTGQSSSYLPVSLNITAISGSGNVLVKAIDDSITKPTYSLGDSIQILRHYFNTSSASGITALTANVTLGYTSADLAAAGITKDSTLHVYQSNGANWIDVPITSRDVTNKTVTISGVTSLSQFVIGKPFGKVVTIAVARTENAQYVAIHSLTGDTLIVQGVVTSPNIGGYYSSYFIQDATAGIDVYSATLMNFKIGDSVFVVGTVDQYNGLVEIVPLVGDSVHFGLLKHGAALPKPKLLRLHDFVRTAGYAESYQGQLIEIDTLYKTSGTWPASGSSASIYVTNLSKMDTAQLYVNKNTDVPGTAEHLYPVNVVGVVSQYGTDSTGFEVIPLDTTDIWKTPGVPSLATIAQARVDANSDGIPDHKVTGDTLMIYGIVTSPNMGSTYTSYYIQDATAGIDVYKSTTMSFSVGDSVFVIGTITQNHGLTEISPLAADSAHFGYLKHKATVPAPKHITLHQYALNGEAYEGSLIEVDSLYKLGGSWGSGATDSVTNLTKLDTALIYINANTDVASFKEPKYPINLVGIASQYSSGASVVTGGYEIIPPDSIDIGTIVAVPNLPVIASPNGTTGEPRRTTLKWNTSANATEYHLQVASDSSRDSIGGFKAVNVVFDTTLSDTAKKLSTPLAATTKYYWHVSAIGIGGTSAYSTTANFTTGTGIDVVNEFDGLPKEFALYQNYPNPFNPSTTIRYDLPKNSYVKVTIYDILGRLVTNLVEGAQTANRYSVEWDPSGLSSGVYLCRISAQSQDGSGNFTSVKKLLYMK
jgi:hypothetical protein